MGDNRGTVLSAEGNLRMMGVVHVAGEERKPADVVGREKVDQFLALMPVRLAAPFVVGTPYLADERYAGEVLSG